LEKKTNDHSRLRGWTVPNPLAKHPPWRQLIIISTVLPLMIMLGVLAFAWPVARLAPRDLPVGIVGADSASQAAVTGLTSSDPGGFEFSLYTNQAAASAAIEDRDIYGAFVVGGHGVTVLEASAASPTVAQLLTSVGQNLARAAATQAEAATGVRPAIPVRSVDVVPTSAQDPRGMVFGSALLPLTICGVIMAAVVALVLRFRPAGRQILSVTVVAGTASVGAYLIAQGYLGALPHEHLATWGSLFLTLLAISAPAAVLIALIGPAGLGLAGALMVFIGNPFSGATSAPQLLPTWVGHIGQWLPPGAGASLLRSTAYFSGHGASGHLNVLIVWIVLGFAAIVVGHHPPFRFAASLDRAHPAAAPGPAPHDPAGGDWAIPGPEQAGQAQPGGPAYLVHPRHARYAGQESGDRGPMSA
jgi:hypothetical protein